MPSTLATLRQTPQISPKRFVAANPGCWIQYYDDTPAKDPVKALSTNTFDAAVAMRKQEKRCAVCFSLQAFGRSRTKEELLCFRNMGVDVDLVPAGERPKLSMKEIERRKDVYLTGCLLPFPLKPHWLIETGHGFHIIFRVLPPSQRSEEGVPEAEALNRRLIRALRGDENAVLLTQVLRVPGTFQFKDPEHPFLCRLLINNARDVCPHALEAVESVLNAWEKFHAPSGDRRVERTARKGSDRKAAASRDGLGGVPEGQRNVVAAAIAGTLLHYLPEHLWEMGGWGGLKEWNQRNAVPLPDRELRSVFESIAKGERAQRRPRGPDANGTSGFSPSTP